MLFIKIAEAAWLRFRLCRRKNVKYVEFNLYWSPYLLLTLDIFPTTSIERCLKDFYKFNCFKFTHNKVACFASDSQKHRYLNALLIFIYNFIWDTSYATACTCHRMSPRIAYERNLCTFRCKAADNFPLITAKNQTANCNCKIVYSSKRGHTRKVRRS